MNFLSVALGGAMGAMLRYGLSGWLHTLTGAVFPVGTLAVNIIGSAVIGLVLQLSTERFLMPAELRLLLTTGLCGGLTTFSTFSYETLALLQAQQWLAAAGNVALNVVLCGLAVYLGMVVARAI